MPLIKRGIEPVNLSRGNVAPGVKNELECVTNNTLANVIRQLSGLSKYAEDMFGELFRDANAIFTRGQRLQARVDRLKVKVTQLDSTVEEVSLQDINLRKPFKSSVIKDQQCFTLFSRSHAISETYQDCDSPPALSKLNPYREDGKDSLKFYTDPTYFFELWSQDMQRDTELQKKELRKKHRRKPKTRQADNVKVRQVKSRQEIYQKQAMGKEFVPEERRPEVPHHQQQHQQHYENRSPSRPNSLEIPAHLQIGNEQNYPPGSHEHDAYSHANGPIGHTMDGHGGQYAPGYNAQPQNGHMDGRVDMYNQGPGYREGSPQHTPTRRGPASRAPSNITSPRPSQPPPAPPGVARLGDRSESTSRESLPPPPPPPPGGMGMPGARNTPPYSPSSTPTRMLHEMNLRDSPVRHTPSPQMQHQQYKSSTPDSVDLPPPPPPPSSQTPDTPGGHMGVMPPPPPTPPPPEMNDMIAGGPAGAPPPPAPPPPPPIGAIMSNSFKDTSKMPNGSVPTGHLGAPHDAVSNTSSTTVSSGSVPSEQPAEEGAMDERSDLLCAIREGIKLRKVERQQKDEQRRHTGGHLDVQSIMEAAFEMRRKALEADASDDEEDEDEDLDEWSDEG